MRNHEPSAVELAAEPTVGRKWLSAPTMLKLKHEFAGAFSSDNFDRLIARIREIMHDPGVVERTASSFTWSSSRNQHALQPEMMIVVRVDGAETSLIATDRLDGMLVRGFGKIGGLLVTGGLVAPLAASVVIPTFTPMFLVAWLGGVYGAMRRLYRRAVGNRARKLKDVFDTMCREIQPALA
jgi:hypothetical protein